MPVTYRKAVSSHFQQPTRSVFQYPSQYWQNQYLPFSTTNQITAFQYPSQKSKKSISSHFQQAIRSQFFSILPRSGKKSVSSHFQQPIWSLYLQIPLVWLESHFFPFNKQLDCNNSVSSTLSLICYIWWLLYLNGTKFQWNFLLQDNSHVLFHLHLYLFQNISPSNLWLNQITNKTL